MYSSKDSYFIEKHLNGSINPRRMSTSGFEYPKDLSNIQNPNNFTTISEEKMQPSMTNIQPSVNGAKKNEFVIPNFFSETNINISNQCDSSIRNMMSTSHSGAIDSRVNYKDPTSIPRFISTPIIANTTVEESIHNNNNNNNNNNNLLDSKSFTSNNYSYGSHSFIPNSCTSTCNDIPIQYNHRFMESMCPTNQYYHNFDNGSFMPSPYVIYDPHTNSFQSVLLVPQMMPHSMMNQSMEMNDENQFYSQRFNNGRNIQNNSYPNYKNFTLPDNSNLNSEYQNFDNQIFVESNGYSHNNVNSYVSNELIETGDIDEIHRTESESLPSLNRNICGDSEEYTSDDDQLNTVHGDEMLEELQKLSSVFTNVVNVSIMSRNSNTSEPVELLNNNNSSRFKRTRIKERTTYWRNNQALVKDNLVKIIPSEILKIPFIDNEYLDKLEHEIFGDQLTEQDSEKKIIEQPDCIHSILHCSTGFNDLRILKHSNRTSQRCRSTATPRSLNEFPHMSNQLINSNISSRYATHRKSLQIPVPFPLFVNKYIPLLSPVIPHCKKTFYDQSNPNIVNRRKRRWSVSCSRLDTGSSNSLRTNCVNHQNESPRDQFTEFLDASQSEDLLDREVHGFINSFETRIDHHLFCLKRSLIAQFDVSLRDMRSELKSMKNTQIELESQLIFYKNKLNSLEQTIKNSLPENEWKSFGIGFDIES